MSLESRNKQRLNQANVDRIERLLRETEQRNLMQPPAYAIGNRGGKVRVQLMGQGERNLEPITNGGIGNGDRVRLQGNLADAMPHYSEENPTSETVTYPIKLVSVKRSSDKIEYFVTAITLDGKCKFDPNPIYTIELADFPGLNIRFFQIDSTGGGRNDWIFAIVYFYEVPGAELLTLRLKYVGATVKRQQTLELKSVDNPKYRALLSGAGIDGNSNSSYKGFGFWAIANCYAQQIEPGQFIWVSSASPDDGQFSFAWYEGEWFEVEANQMYVLPETTIPCPPPGLPTFLSNQRRQKSYCDSRLQSALLLDRSEQLSSGATEGQFFWAYQQLNLKVLRDGSVNPVESNNTVFNFDADEIPVDPDDEFYEADMTFTLFILLQYLSRESPGIYTKDQFYFIFRQSITNLYNPEELPLDEANPKRRRLLLYTAARREDGNFARIKKKVVTVTLPIPDEHLQEVTFSGETYKTLETIAASFYP